MRMAGLKGRVPEMGSLAQWGITLGRRHSKTTRNRFLFYETINEDEEKDTFLSTKASPQVVSYAGNASSRNKTHPSQAE